MSFTSHPSRWVALGLVSHGSLGGWLGLGSSTGWLPRGGGSRPLARCGVPHGHRLLARLRTLAGHRGLVSCRSAIASRKAASMMRTRLGRGATGSSGGRTFDLAQDRDRGAGQDGFQGLDGDGPGFRLERERLARQRRIEACRQSRTEARITRCHSRAAAEVADIRSLWR